jgi:hypothetical protein
MTAEKALIAYDYQERNGLFVRKSGHPSDAWKKLPDGGWACFSVATPVYAVAGVADPSGGKAWGKATPEIPGWVQTPYRLADRWASVGGLHPETHPECFEWVWPDERVEEIHVYGLRAIQGEEFVRQDDGSRVKVG